MSTGSPKPRQGAASRWGSLLSGAVANLESRLDTILADEGTVAARNTQLPVPDPAGGDRTSRGSSVQAHSRSSSRNRTNGPQHERVSRLAALDGGLRTSSSRTPSEGRASSKSRVPIEATSRSSLDSVDTESALVGTTELSNTEDARAEDVQIESGVVPKDISQETEFSSALEDFEARSSTDVAEPDPVVARSSKDIDMRPLSLEEYQSQLAQLRAEQKATESQHREETSKYLERIDALQAKLQYLTNETTESARRAVAEAGAESLQKKLAAKDEQIALLMEEGQRFSKAEVNQASIAKKLRLKVAEESRALADTKRKLSTTERSSSELAEKVKRLEGSQREASTKLSRFSRLEKEVDGLKAAKDEKESTIEALRRQLESESTRADNAERKANSAALEEQKRLNKSLREDLENAKAESLLSQERLKAELSNSQEHLKRESEHKSMVELELRNEISVLESRLEALRARTEEASSGSSGDVQAKLIRQVETMQSQYTLASENWQGIESALQARLTNLEEERDEATRRESDARRKAREFNNASRRIQEELEEALDRYQSLEQELQQNQKHAEVLEGRVSQFERDLTEANKTIEEERQAWKTSLANRIEEERVKWRQDSIGFPGHESLMSQVESPSLSMRKGSGLDIPLQPGRRPFSRGTLNELNIPPPEKSHSRRSSIRPPRPSDVMSPNDADSGRSTPFANGNVPETPSIHPADQDDMFERSSSPHRTVNDMISGSTAAAGPSVQLVERMSAAVRRLESEKAASKDEMARVAAQRDDARQEVVSLMREVEDKRAVDAQVKKLEKSTSELEQRYQTTLEMLGEKSERVEELEADVADLKNIYRELVETTTKR